MARTTLLDTSTVNLGEIFSNGKIYRVPPYQRDYSWDEEQWEDLWNDIMLLQNSALPHYMGALVFQASSDGATVIDGQQRLATLSILALAVIKHLRDLGRANIEPEDNEQRIVLLTERYIGTKDPGSLRYSSKLILNENDNGFYQDHLVRPRDPVSERKLSASERRLWKAFRFFDAKIGGVPELSKSGADLANFFAKWVAERLVFIQIRVEDELSAYTVFETLNARGLELTSTDLIKNYLFSKVAQSPSDLDHARREWNEIMKRVGLDEFPTFLRHFINTRQILVRKERLFKEVKQQVSSGEQVFHLLEQLHRAAEWYRALGDPHDELWDDYPIECARAIESLRLFRATQYKTLLLACFDRGLDQDTIRRVLRACEVVTFRVNVIGQRSAKPIEITYNKVAMELTRGDRRTAREIIEGLDPIYLRDEDFQKDFATASISATSNRRLVMYVLCNLENRVRGTDVDYETSQATIEHILPTKPKEPWPDFPEEHHERYVERLGNYALLERNLNMQAQNLPYEEKKPLYEKSQYETTNDLHASAWTRHAIQNRQEKLAKMATTVWRLAEFDNHPKARRS